MTATLAQTPLCEWHASHGGRMVDFAGWLMPVQYASIVAEHQATRTGVGLFDVSHMGRIRFDGPQAGPFLDRLLTRRVADLELNQVRYSLITNDDGGILDDVLVYHVAGRGSKPDYFQLVVNAGNRAKILGWIHEQREAFPNLEMVDHTGDTAMLAVQGPLAGRTIQPLLSDNPLDLTYYHCRETLLAGASVLVSRTGYTGEDGFELTVPAAMARMVWEAVLVSGREFGAVPAGLGCRDTLRLEAAMPLYGHELNEEINPYQAGLGFAVDLEGRAFPGSDRLAEAKQTTQRRRVGLTLDERRVPREGYAVLSGDKSVGVVTSGTFSPTFDQPIAMAYVDADFAKVGQDLQIEIRGRAEAARVVKLPFYRRRVARAE